MSDSWQPISTAPRDGTKILAFSAGECVAVQYSTIPDGTAFWELAFNPRTGTRAVLGTPITHWRPLPAPPSMKDEGHG